VYIKRTKLHCCWGVAQGVLRRIISRRMVEPQRRFFDLHRLYMNKHIARVRGRGFRWGQCHHNA
jgi:hypothetical protein